MSTQVIRLPRAKDTTTKTDTAVKAPNRASDSTSKARYPVPKPEDVKASNKASDSTSKARYPVPKPDSVLDPDTGLYTPKGQVFEWYNKQRRSILSRELSYMRLSLDTEAFLVSQAIEAEVSDYFDRAASEVYASMDVPTDIDAVRADIERLKALGVSVDDSTLDTAAKSPMTGRQAIDSIRIELYLAVDMILQRLKSISEVCNPIKR